MRALVVVLLLSAFAAHAVMKGGALFIKVKGVKLLKYARANSVAVSRELAVGTEVKWLGASANDQSFHEVEVEGKRGFVVMSALSSVRQTEPAEPSPLPFATGSNTGREFGPSRKPYVSPAVREAEVELLHLEALNASLRAK